MIQDDIVQEARELQSFRDDQQFVVLWDAFTEEHSLNKKLALLCIKRPGGNFASILMGDRRTVVGVSGEWVGSS